MLRRFLDRLNSDESFKESVRKDPASVLAQFELSASEQAALGTGDEDALRRLSGMDVAGYVLVTPACSRVCSMMGCSLNCPTADRSQYTCEDVGCIRI
jgi:hypothetical protein